MNKEIKHIRGLIEETDLCLKLLGENDITREEELIKGFYNYNKIEAKKIKQRRAYNRRIIRGQTKGDNNV